MEIRTCHQEGWETTRNGELLAAAEAAGFDIFVTADQNLRYQQNLAARKLAIIELPRNELHLLLPLIPSIEQAVATILSGSYIRIPLAS